MALQDVGIQVLVIPGPHCLQEIPEVVFGFTGEGLDERPFGIEEYGSRDHPFAAVEHRAAFELRVKRLGF